MEAMIVLTRREKKKTLLKLQKQIVRLIQDYNVNPLAEITTEMSFLVDMSEKDLNKLKESLDKIAKENDFEVEIIKQ